MASLRVGDRRNIGSCPGGDALVALWVSMAAFRGRGAPIPPERARGPGERPAWRAPSEIWQTSCWGTYRASVGRTLFSAGLPGGTWGWSRVTPAGCWAVDG